MVDEYCWEWDDAHANFGLEIIRDFHVEFVYRVMKRLREQKSSNRPTRYQVGESRCYIEHVSNKQKQRCNALHMRWDENAGVAHFERTYKITRNDD